jgi:hypothetical protein
MIPPQAAFTEYEGTVLPSYKWLTDREFCLSGNKDWPVRVINLNSVEDIELKSGSLKTVNTDDKTIEVNGSKGQVYFVSSNSKGYQCTCPGFQFRKSCKHIAEAAKI